MAQSRSNLSSPPTNTAALEDELGKAGQALVNEAHYLVLNGSQYLSSYSQAASRIRDAHTLWTERDRLRGLRVGF